jgi:hypothetical protein
MRKQQQHTTAATTAAGAAATKDADTSDISASSAIAAPVPTSASATKSKWLLGGVVSTPVFTPSKRSGMLRAGSTDLSRVGLSEDGNDDDGSSSVGGDFNPDDEDYIAGDSRAHSPIRLDALDEGDSHSAAASAPATPQRPHN